MNNFFQKQSDKWLWMKILFLRLDLTEGAWKKENKRGEFAVETEHIVVHPDLVSIYYIDNRDDGFIMIMMVVITNMSEHTLGNLM